MHMIVDQAQDCHAAINHLWESVWGNAQNSGWTNKDAAELMACKDAALGEIDAACTTSDKAVKTRYRTRANLIYAQADECRQCHDMLKQMEYDMKSARCNLDGRYKQTLKSIQEKQHINQWHEYVGHELKTLAEKIYKTFKKQEGKLNGKCRTTGWRGKIWKCDYGLKCHKITKTCVRKEVIGIPIKQADEVINIGIPTMQADEEVIGIPIKQENDVK